MLQRITHEIDEEIQQATQQALHAAPPARGIRAGASLFGRRSTRRPQQFARGAALPRRAHDHGGPDQRHAARGDAAQSRHPGVRRGRGRLQPRSQPARGEGQGRRLQGDARVADGVRLARALQHAAGGGGHRGPRHRDGDARAEAGGRDSVLRLHLAGDDADSRRAGHPALALQREFLVPGGDPRADRRIPERRRDLSQPVRRSRVHAHSRAARGDAVERAGRLRPAAHRAALRRSGAVPGAQAALSRAVQPLAASGRGLHDSVRPAPRS